MKRCDECDQLVSNRSGVRVDLESGNVAVLQNLGSFPPKPLLLLEALADCFPRPADYDYLTERMYSCEADIPRDERRSLRVHVHKLRGLLAWSSVRVVQDTTGFYFLEVGEAGRRA